jgi:glycosyltransferase involved in cell wall biosynthesis
LSAQSPRRLLVFNCHEAWVHQLRWLDWELDIITDLPGRAVKGWDAAMRPVPAGARQLSLAQAKAEGGGWHCIICHNVSDLLDAAELRGPRLLVLHVTLEGRMQEEQSELTAAQIRSQLAQYCRLNRVHVVAISPLKGHSWGFGGDIVSNAVDVEDYPPWSGELREGIRVSNLVTLRPRTLLWDLHQAAFAGLPLRLVGRNPDLPGVQPSQDWADLKELLRQRRFFVHTAEPTLEDGFNLAMLEAMATGLPVLGNLHPTSPIEHGVSGFLSDEPAQLRAYAETLLDNRELAATMGQAARQAVLSRFGVTQFRDGFGASLQSARALYKAQYKQSRQGGKPQSHKR